MKKKNRRIIAMIILATIFSVLPSLAKALIALPLMVLLLIDYDNFSIDLLKEGVEA